jgi:DNA-binding CsgD family transcriptional regulator
MAATMSSYRLSHLQYARLSNFLLDLYTLRDREAFIAHTLSSLHSLIKCELISYSEIDLSPNRVVYRWSPDDTSLRVALNPAIEQTIHEHPCIPFILRTRGARSVKVSDVMPFRALKTLGYYQEFLRKVETNYQLGTIMEVRPSFFSPIAFNRKHKDFQHSDHTVMDLLRPHFIQAFRNANAVSTLNEETVAPKLNNGNRCVISTTQDGRIQLATDRARKLLTQYCPPDKNNPDRLPAILRDWLMHENRRLESVDIVPDSLMPLHIHGKNGTLQIRLARKGLECLLMIDEHTQLTSFAAYEKWALSRRENEILGWVTKGKTNSEIGIILGISPRTVQKHLERVYVKLGVENRTTASTLAIEATRPCHQT